jgi:hypothetical protein
MEALEDSFTKNSVLHRMQNNYSVFNVSQESCVYNLQEWWRRQDIFLLNKRYLYNRLS